MSRWILLAGLGLSLLGCGSGGNLRSDNTYHGSPLAPNPHPKYDPYQAAGDAPVTWVAPTYDRMGTIVAPEDPAQEWMWQDYPNAPWFKAVNGPTHPAGSF